MLCSLLLVTGANGQGGSSCACRLSSSDFLNLRYLLGVVVFQHRKLQDLDLGQVVMIAGPALALGHFTAFRPCVWTWQIKVLL